MQFYQSMMDFLQANERTVFRFWVYRRMFTPYEEKEALTDESVFEDITARFGIIRQCIPIGNNDFVLGIQLFYDEEIDADAPYESLEFFKFSEIRMAFYKDDQMKEE